MRIPFKYVRPLITILLVIEHEVCIVEIPETENLARRK